mgnify:FL=1|tara:strand:+ start:60649 stop:61311 length:663 start_codon:yes stop_codon:yes gene_type:complete
MNFIFYKGLKRDEWAELKLKSVKQSMPNNIVSDIGAGWGYFEKNIEKHNFIWQPFDYVKKLPESILWDLNNLAPNDVKRPGFVSFLEVYEHLANPELGIKHISEHILDGGFLALSCPNPFFSKSKYTMIFKNNLYAFQSKHLVEHHVNVPLPHVITFYLEKHGFHILEKGIIGQRNIPKFKLSFNFLKDLVKYALEKLLGGRSVLSKGDTQVYFAIKKTE